MKNSLKVTLLCTFALTLLIAGVQAQEIVGSGDATSGGTISQALNPYPLMAQSIGAMKAFIFEINTRIAEATKGLFMAVAGIYVVVIGIKYYATSQINPLQQLTVLFGIIFAYAMVYGGNFEKYVYDPTIHTTVNLAAFVLETSSGGKVSSANAMESAMATVTDQISQIYTIGDRLTDQAEEAGLTDIGTKIYSYLLLILLMAVYTVLSVVFFTIYTIGLIGMHFILFFFPWAMLIGAFPFGRGVLINWFKTIVSFGLVPVFASVAMGVTIYTLSSVAPKIAESMAGATTVSITSKVYQQALLIGLFSIFFHLKASEFAQTLTGSQVTNFGQFFGSVMGVGATGYQAAGAALKSGKFVPSAARGSYAAMGSTYNAARDGFNSASRAVQSYLKK